MSAQSALSVAIQLIGGLVLAPALVGLIQHWKARLQGRRGPTPLQPYRELRRLWRKSSVSVEGAGPVYRHAPLVVAACAAVAVLLVPVASNAPDLGVGRDAFVLLGLFALGRFALAAASWDVGNGFALMGASRDLTIAVFSEAALVLALAVAALVAGTTDLVAMVGSTAGASAWTTPALALAAIGFAIVVVAETGRQPVDNPDTHLELTMIHEGALLEYAGRDLVLLHWAAAARHWIVLVLAASIFLPHPESALAQVALLPLVLAALCASLALTETVVAKTRILLAPRLLAIAGGVSLLGVISWLVEQA